MRHKDETNYKRLQAFLKKKPHNVDELVRKVGVSKRTIYRWLIDLGSESNSLVRFQGTPARYQLVA